MRLIAALETAPRRIYTGAIGFAIGGKWEVESGKTPSQLLNSASRTPNPARFQFSVAIRTVLIDRPAGLAEYGVGGGVVWDSTAAGEYEECYIKARLLTRPRPRFALLESLLWTPAEGCFLLDLHLRRLAGAAEYFGFPLSLDDLRQALDSLAAALPPEAHKLRLLLHRNGRIETGAQALSADTKPEPAMLRLAAGPVSSTDPFLYYKTTHRQAYAIARRGLPADCEAVFFNQRGELTESETANLVLHIDGRRLTPPIAAGLLPGVMRTHLLAAGEIEEAPLAIDDLQRAEAIYLINSVRKWRAAVLV
jgi:para-aminobenzoate synthetase/4-amino-4-deoxychorismate lyase